MFSFISLKYHHISHIYLLGKTHHFKYGKESFISKCASFTIHQKWTPFVCFFLYLECSPFSKKQFKCVHGYHVMTYLLVVYFRFQLIELPARLPAWAFKSDINPSIRVSRWSPTGPVLAKIKIGEVWSLPTGICVTGGRWLQNFLERGQISRRRKSGRQEMKLYD